MMKERSHYLRIFAVLGLILGLAFPKVAWADGVAGKVSGWYPGATVKGTLNGASFKATGVTIHMELTDGPKVPVFCTDIPHHVYKNDKFLVSDEEMACPIRWILHNYPPRFNSYTPWPDDAPGALSNRDKEMAARQAAVWHFSDGLLPEKSTTVGDRAWEIIDAVPDDPCAADQPAITFTPGNAVNPVNTTQTFTVTVSKGGEPVEGQMVNLSLENDTGTLGADALTTDVQGQATFTITHDAVDTTSQIQASAEMTLPVGTIFVGVNSNRQKLVLGEESVGLVHADASARWTGTGSVTTLSFDDFNGNGEYDTGELELAGWTVELEKISGSYQKSTTTDSEGLAHFSGLSAGDYRVTEVLKSGWYSTTTLVREFHLDADESEHFAFGQLKLPVIIGHVFQDDNLDDKPDEGEPPLEDWELKLYRDDGSSVAGMHQSWSDGDGKVIFSNDPTRDPPDITVGTYYVEETLKEGWYTTTGISGTVTVDSGDIGHVWLGNVNVMSFAVNDDEYRVNENETLSVAAPGILDNDSAYDEAAPLEVSGITDNVDHGTLSHEAAGSFTYEPDADWSGEDTFTYEATDDINTGAAVVTIIVNDQPEVDLNGPDEGVDFEATFTEDEDPVSIVDDDLTVSDGDDTHIFSATVTLTDRPDGTSERLSASTTGNVAVSYDSDSGVLSLSGSDTCANYEQVLRSVEYDNTSQDPDDADRSVRFVVNDSEMNSDAAVSTVHVIPVNDQPVAQDNAYATDEDSILNIGASSGVLNGDSDVDDTVLTSTLSANVEYGSLTLEADGSFTYDPTQDATLGALDTGEERVITFTYRANDGEADSNVVTVSITVDGVNDAPEAADDAYTTAEDTPLTVDAPGVLDNDSDVDDSSLSAILDDEPSHGELSLNEDGSFTYTPDEDFNDSDSFTYHANDGDADSNIATVEITVTPVNDPPTANDDTSSAAEDTAVTIDVRGNDTDPEDGSEGLTVDSVTQPDNGAVTNDGDDVTYTPDAEFHGTDTFTYTIRDSEGETDQAVVTVTVYGVNDSPVAANDTESTDEDTAVTVDVLGNDTDADGDTLTVDSVVQPDSGAVTNNENNVIYIPDDDFHGTDTFTYSVADGRGGSDSATVTITVVAVNDAPLAVDDAYTTAEDTTLTVDASGVLSDLLENDSDIEGSALTAITDTNPSHGALISFDADGYFTYTPEPDFNGEDSFTYHVHDGEDDSGIATVVINVTPVNDPPTANDDTSNTQEETPVAISVQSNDFDVDGDTISVSLVGSPDNGAAVTDGNVVTYTPQADFNGHDTFTYTIRDTGGLTDTATVTVEVGAENDPPQALDDGATTEEDTAVTVAVLENDTDPDNDLIVDAAGEPQTGTLEIKDNEIIYTPDADFYGTDTFTYTARENPDGLTDTATVVITVTAVNDPPQALDDAYPTDEESATTTDNVLDNDSDVDTPRENLTLSEIITDATQGTVTDNGDGTFGYDPDGQFDALKGGEETTDTFEYTISDGAAEDSAVVIITITGLNDGPTAVDDSRSIKEDTSVTIPVRNNDIDVDDGTEGLSVASFTQPTDGEVHKVGADLKYTPPAEFHGVVTFTYTIRDSGGLTDQATVTVTVHAVNDAPDALDDAEVTDEDTPVTIDVLQNDSDPDDTINVSAVGNPAHGATQIENNQIVYTPDGDFYGTDTFTYTISEARSGGLTDTATVTVTVEPVNDEPAFSKGADVTVDEDSGSYSEAAWATDIYAGADNESEQTLTFHVSSDNAGLFSTQPTVDAEGNLSFEPAPDENGVAHVTLYLTDDGGAANGGDDVSASQSFTITVRPVNDAPSFTKGADQTVGAKAGPQFVNRWADDITAGPLNEFGQELEFTLVSDNEDLFLSPPRLDEVSGKLTFTPDPDRHGSTVVTVWLRDDGGTVNGGQDTVSDTFVINILENSPPVAVDDFAVTEEGEAVSIYVLDNDEDPDGDALNIQSVGGSTQGQAEFVPLKEGYVHYTPQTTENTVFTYTVSDGSMSATARVWVFVGEAVVNSRPEANDDYACTHGAPRTIDVLSNDNDADGDVLQVIAVGEPLEGGNVQLSGDQIIYEPPASFIGTAHFTYTVSDGEGEARVGGSLTDEAWVWVSAERNQAPIVVDDEVRATIEAQRTIYVLENDSDECDADYLTIIDVTQPITGSVVWDETTITYIPPQDYDGPMPYTVAFSYTVSDNACGNLGLAPMEADGTVSITVTTPVGGYTEPLRLQYMWAVLLLTLSVVGASAALRMRRVNGR